MPSAISAELAGICPNSVMPIKSLFSNIKNLYQDIFPRLTYWPCAKNTSLHKNKQL